MKFLWKPQALQRMQISLQKGSLVILLHTIGFEVHKTYETLDIAENE